MPPALNSRSPERGLSMMMFTYQDMIQTLYCACAVAALLYMIFRDRNNHSDNKRK